MNKRPTKKSSAIPSTRKAAQMWQGRFSENMSSSMERLSISLHFDKKLFREDIEGSLAHAQGLLAAKVLKSSEWKAMDKELKQIREDIELKGSALFKPQDEDIHMAVERILTERLGDLGKKLHTGRSRNDQVATAFKLYCRNKSESLRRRIVVLQKAIHAQASAYQNDLMPGYTHVQQAQPVSIAHYLLSFFWILERDKTRLANLDHALCQMPLGSGALAGSAFPYEREAVARRLGFSDLSPNSMDATAQRDFALELLSALTLLGTTLSRYAEDFVLFSSQEYDYLRLADAYTTGSSMMPQKKNPDSMELIRGKTGRLLGNFVRLATVLKGLPMCYGRDLQEDKEPVFDSVETMELCLEVMTGAMATLAFKTEVIKSKMHPGMLATDLADYLVKKGVPFRDAHHIVGSLVGKADAQGVSFLELPARDWRDIPDGEAFRKKLTFAYSAERRNILGGTGSGSVKRQLAMAAKILR